MSDKLTEFLTNLCHDNDLVCSYEKDKAGCMKAHGISDHHIDLVVNKKYDEIQNLLGGDYNISKNNVIRAYKK